MADPKRVPYATRLPDELVQALRVYCVVRRIKQSQVVEYAIADYLYAMGVGEQPDHPPPLEFHP